MRGTTGLRLLGGSTNSASSWIGVTPQAVQLWRHFEQLLRPTRDRVLAAVLRKAAAQAQGLTARQWWADDEVHGARLEHVLELHNDALVEFLRQALQEVPPEHPSEHGQRLKPAQLAAAA